MKYDLYPIIIEGLKEIYSFDNSFSTLELYRYLNIRCSIIKSNKKISDVELIDFILSELNVTSFGMGINDAKFEHVIYKGEVYLNYEWASEFLENMRFRVSLEGSLCYKEIQDELFIKGYRKARKYKDLKAYNKYIKYFRLIELNELYSASPISATGLDGFGTSVNHNPFKRTEEEVLNSEIESSRLLDSNTTTYITEEDLEDYFYSNIEVIEDGLKVVDRQVEIDGGVIDILAIDSKNNICIIELKINQDKSIIWQSIHYPSEIKKKYKERTVRMLTIVPKYSSYIFKALQEVGNIETYTYNINVSKGAITNLDVSRVYNEI